MLYDLINDSDFPDDARVPYRLMRWWMFECHYQYYQVKIRNKQRRGEHWFADEYEVAWAYEQFELSFHLPIERLMLEVLALLMRGGRGPEQIEAMHRDKIAAILADHNLQDMLATLEGVELREFTYDLKLLGLL